MKRKLLRAAALALSLIFLALATVIPANAVPQITDYRSSLIARGFPDSYADALTYLHLIHPSWSFEPLKVTKLNSKYTWSYVLDMETENSPSRSLISGDPAYTAYRHKTNKTLYDSGYYQASAAAVSYFLDPRNFLNEKDIFQFEDLAFNQTVTVSQVEAVLVGTFMAGAKLENGKTYAEYFFEVGKELGISPVHLAARARQEQGVAGSSAHLSGLAGDKLWYYYSNKIQSEDGSLVSAPESGYTEDELKSYNGLYNIYNINAAGTGRFAITLGAMKEAETGTPSKAADWGGSGKWDTKWKAIYGGAYKLCNSYIGNYQNTLYLQKWNVDNRSKSSTGSSRNFWGQYMQNIGGAFSEARTSFNSIASNGCLDCPYSFVIPVYSGMPSNVCADPAGGACATYSRADSKYAFLSYINGVPDKEPISDGYYIGNITVIQSVGVSVSGYSLHTSGVKGYEYSIDGGEWMSTASSHDASLFPANTAKYSRCAASKTPTSFAISTDPLPVGTHTLNIRGVADFLASSPELNCCVYYPIASFDVDVKEKYYTVTQKDIAGTKEEKLNAGAVFTLPAATDKGRYDTVFVGWHVTGDGIDAFLPEGAGVYVYSDMTLMPVYIEMSMCYGASAKIDPDVSALRYRAMIKSDGYSELCGLIGKENVRCGMLLFRTPQDASLASITPTSLKEASISYKMTTLSDLTAGSGEKTYLDFSAETDPIRRADYEVSYSAVAYISIVYSNSASASFFTGLDTQVSSRSVGMIARAALADAESYTDPEKTILREMAGTP